MDKRLILAGVSMFALMIAIPPPGHAQDLSSALGGLQFGGAAAIVGYGFDSTNMTVDLQNAGTVTGNTAVDYGDLRNNDLVGSYSPGAGVAHVQQNNGSSNAISAAAAVQWGIVGDGLVGMGAIVGSNTYSNKTTSHGGPIGARNNLIMDSFNGFSGVATVQQNNGDNNEIGAATAVHGNSGGNATMLQAAATFGYTGDQTGEGNPRIPGRDALVDYDTQRDNTIDPSFTDASGVLTVQQNNGNANAMGVANAVAVNMGSGFIVQIAGTSGTVGAGQTTFDTGLRRDNLIDDSFDGAAGVMTVQQNNGDANVMGVSSAVAANLDGIPHPEFDGALNNDVLQIAITSGTLDSVVAGDDDTAFADNLSGQRVNTITGSYQGAKGVASVQQNNGSNNVMGIANAVQANINNRGLTTLNGLDVAAQFAIDVGGTISNAAAHGGTALNPEPDHRQNTIAQGSFYQYGGVATVQQNNGDNNIMGAANAAVANINSGDKTDLVLASVAASFGNVNGNNAFEPKSGANRHNDLLGSFDEAAGMVTVQQNNGNNNVIGAANSAVANVNNRDPFAGFAGNAALGSATVVGNTAIDGIEGYTDRVNTINNGSFDNARGMSAVQQNNGDNNVIGSSSSVVVNSGYALGQGFGPAASLAVLGANVSGNFTTVAATVVVPGYLNTIANSYNGAAGVMTVQQNNGSNNAIQSAISVVANF